MRGSFNEPGIPSLIKWLMRSCCARCLEFKGKGQSGPDCALVKLHSPMRAEDGKNPRNKHIHSAECAKCWEGNKKGA